MRRGWPLTLFLLGLFLLSGFFLIPGVPSSASAAPSTGPSVSTHLPSASVSAGAVVHPQVTITSFTISPSTVMVGATTDLNMTVSGTGPYLYNYSSGMPSSCPQTASISSSTSYSVSCTPTISGTYTITAAVIDLGNNFNSAVSTATLNVTATPVGPTINSFLASPPQIALGGSTYFNSSVSGGTPPYTYAYGSLPPGCSSSNTSSLFCTPSKVGNYSVGLTVTDSAGLYTTGSTTLTVGNPAGPLITAFTATPSSFTLGKSTMIAVTATGGSPPYTYAYTGLPAGCTSSSAASISCTPTAAGTAHVNVTVTDTKTLKSSGTTLVTVNALPTVSSFTASPAAVSAGGTTTLSVAVSGGTSPFTYSYSALPPGCATANTASLVCTPTTVGNYTPSVTAVDADGFATPAATTPLTVNGPPSVSRVTASPSHFPLEASTQISVTAVGGTPPYSYTYVSLPPGCITANTATLACTPTRSGVFNISVAIYDRSGRAASGATQVTVYAVPEVLSFTATPATVATHSTVIFSVQASGGVSPYGYSYTGLPTGCVTSNTSSLSCSPVSTGRFNVTVRVSDARGNSNTSVTTVSVTAAGTALSIPSFTVSPATVPTGSSATFSVTASGGKPPYSYTYAGLPPSCATANTATLACTPGAPGNYSVTVTVTDSAGASTTATTDLQVTGTVQPLIVTLSANRTSLPPSTPLILRATVTGGEGPFSYAWSVNGVNDSSAPDATAWNWTPAQKGTYSVRVWVTDARRVVAGSSPLTIDVGAVSANTGSGSGVAYDWLVLAAVLAVVVLLFVFFMKGVRGRRATSEPATEAAPTVPEGFFNPVPTEPEAPVASPPPSPEVAPTPASSAPVVEPMPAEHVGPDLYATCPRCLDPIGPDMYCPRCGVRWEADSTNGDAAWKESTSDAKAPEDAPVQDPTGNPPA